MLRLGEQLMFSSGNRNSVDWVDLAGQFEELAHDLSEVHAKSLALKGATQLRTRVTLERSLYLLQLKILERTPLAQNLRRRTTRIFATSRRLPNIIHSEQPARSGFDLPNNFSPSN
jgi:hypothetical protein